MSRGFLLALVIVKAGLLGWGILGFVEYYELGVKFELQNENFPMGVQFLHWLLLVMTGGTFVIGFFSRWQHTPYLTTTLYAALATLCFIETVDFGAFGGGATSLLIMMTEFVVYTALSAFLLISVAVSQHFRIARP